MTTVAEIETAIEQLPPEDLRVLGEWVLKRVENAAARPWTPEELGAAADQMVAEEDPVKAKALWERIAVGFYGEADA